jgi:hypothetical protein
MTQVIYAHHRASDGSLFYYGSGKEGRQFVKKRNAWHADVVRKHGIVVKVLARVENKRIAHAVERGLISDARAREENIVNDDYISLNKSRKLKKIGWFDSNLQSTLGKRGAAASKALGVSIFSKEARIKAGRIGGKISGKISGKIVGAMPWWVHTISGECKRSHTQPSPEHVRGRKLTQQEVK